MRLAGIIEVPVLSSVTGVALWQLKQFGRPSSACVNDSIAVLDNLSSPATIAPGGISGLSVSVLEEDFRFEVTTWVVQPNGSDQLIVLALIVWVQMARRE